MDVRMSACMKFTNTSKASIHFTLSAYHHGRYVCYRHLYVTLSTAEKNLQQFTRQLQQTMTTTFLCGRTTTRTQKATVMYGLWCVSVNAAEMNNGRTSPISQGIVCYICNINDFFIHSTIIWRRKINILSNTYTDSDTYIVYINSCTSKV